MGQGFLAKLFASGQSTCYVSSLVWMCNGGILLLHWSGHLKVDERGVDFIHLLSIAFSMQVFAI